MSYVLNLQKLVAFNGGMDCISSVSNHCSSSSNACGGGGGGTVSTLSITLCT